MRSDWARIYFMSFYIVTMVSNWRALPTLYISPASLGQILKTEALIHTLRSWCIWLIFIFVSSYLLDCYVYNCHIYP